MVTESQSHLKSSVKLSVGDVELHAKLVAPQMSSDVERKSLVAPSWVVQYASKKKDANMSWTVTRFHMKTTTNLGNPKTQSIEVDIPVMSNSVALQPGDVLLC